MTQADVLFYFPQLCGNVQSVLFSENDPRSVVAGGDIRDLPKQEHYSAQPVGITEKENLVSLFFLSEIHFNLYVESQPPTIPLG